MFTVSCYAFHPLILKFVRIWRYVQVVSDVLTCIVSMLCCQCVDMMPLSTSSSGASKPSIQIFKSQLPSSSIVNINHGKGSKESQRAQHLLIDLSSQHLDKGHSKSRENCPYPHKDPAPKDSTRRLKHEPNVLAKKSSSLRSQKSREKIIPAVHNSLKKINKKDVNLSSSITHHK